MIDRPFTVKEAADYLSVNEWTVRRYIRDGMLPRHYVGKTTNSGLRLFESELKTFLNRGQK